MAYLEQFGNDVFISYAHNDNQGAKGEAGTGWVSSFHLDLESRLTELLGAPVSVWRDKKLRGTDEFDNEILRQLRGSAVLVSVVTPSYIRSQYCQSELEEFTKSARQAGGLRVASFQRIVKIVKTPLDGDGHRAFQGTVLGQEFFRKEKDSKYIIEFEPDDEHYRQRLDRLAQDIADGLKAIEKARGSRQTCKGTVYLAETTSDLRKQSERVRDELQAQGYRVVPEAPLPDHVKDIRTVIDDALSETALSIHLVGPRYSKSPEGTDESIIALQYRLALERAVPRVVWIAETDEVVETQQAVFLSSLRNDLQGGLDLLERKEIEDLKDVVLARLAPDAQTPDPVATSSSDLTRIYLICDDADYPLNGGEKSSNYTLALRDYLLEAGFEVKLPPAPVNARIARGKDNKEKLTNCDAVLLYWGLAPDVWVEERISELNKALGWRRKKGPFSAKAIYVTAPDNEVKRIYRTREARVIAHFDDFAPEHLVPFLTDLRQARGQS